MKNTTKSFVVLFVILSIIGLDNYLGISYYNNIDNKLLELKKVNELLESKTLDKETKRYLFNIKREILERKTFVDNVSDSFKQISFTSSKTEIVNEVKQSVVLRNSIIEFISINWFFIFLFAGLPFYFFIIKAFESFWQNLLMVLAVETFLIIFSFILYFFSSIVPTIFGRPYLNYILNFIILLVLITIYSVRLHKKQNIYR
ncbi:hypothetical protein [Flavobacterium sp. LAR06]|uniref:hypothetical protein n=1 Tax=Flavobacterium sp. LAR06 TaxID=3064897 RepID=UPI0035C211B2